MPLAPTSSRSLRSSRLLEHQLFDWNFVIQPLQASEVDAPFTLLDDTALGGTPCSRWYTGCTDEFFRPADVLDGVDDDLHAVWHQGLHALIVAPYEFGEPLIGLPASTKISSSLPGHNDRPRVLLFRTMQVLSPTGVDRLSDVWHDATSATGLFDCTASVDHATYTNAVARTHDWIAAGDTYEVNYTYRLCMATFGAPAALYRRLRARQPVPYDVFIGLPKGAVTLSCLPKLFFSHRASQLVARPMKGTAPASGNVEIDEVRAIALAANEKSRVEDLTIADLLRNDLGHLMRAGSVRIPTLFEATPFGGVLQITSTVEAETPLTVGFADRLRMSFPCGSITSAPKRQTMEIIRALEPGLRGLYTGAIGWVDTPTSDRTMGGVCLSVAIRTLMLNAPGADGLRRDELGIGSDIVHDSVTDNEYAECQLKARFVTALGPGLSLFETMHATRKGVPLLDWRLVRLERSATAFGFPFDRTMLTDDVARACATFEGEGAYRMRLLLTPNGSANVSAVPLSPLYVSWDTPARLLATPQSREATHNLPTHKTTLREGYDAAWQAAEREGTFDTVFFDADGTLAEDGRSTLLVKLDGV